MSALWTMKSVAAAVGGSVGRDGEITGVSIDTRTLEKGDLFVALKDARDGHDFVGNAIERGASAALVSRDVAGVPGEKLIKVGAKVVRHGRTVTLQMAEVAIPSTLFADVLKLIAELRPKPPPAHV